MNCIAWGSPQESKFPFPGDGKLVDEEKFTNIEGEICSVFSEMIRSD
jgi:hypothetical protein